MAVTALESKPEGYGVAEDADNVLGPVDLNQTRALLRKADEGRDAEGNIAFPGRYAHRNNDLPSIVSPTQREVPKEGPSWPTKNEDGSYQLAPGARLEFKPMTDERAAQHAGILPTAVGTIVGAVGGNPWLGGSIGSTITPFVQEPLKEVLKAVPFPSVVIEGGPTSSMEAYDYPSPGRGEF